MEGRESRIASDEAKQEPLEEQAVRLLKRNGFHLTSVESCTGGLFSGRIVNVSGASDVFEQGYVTYSNEAKHRLVGVSEEALAAYGAVSPQVAAEMAEGGARSAGAEAAVAITGIAGPGGGTEQKPVGLVYVACCLCGQVKVRELRLGGTRRENREASVENGLLLLIEMLLDWETRREDSSEN